MTSTTLMTKNRRPIVLGIAVAAFVAAPLWPRLAWAESSPREVVQSMASTVVDILRNSDLSADQKKHKIEDIAYSNIDFPTVSRLVLARNWRDFSPAQQQQFIDEFKQHLSVTYGDNVNNYHNEKVEITGEREEPRGDHTVMSKIVRGGGAKDIPVDYRLRQSDGQWRVIDIIIDGVSMVANFRAQFQDIVSNGGPDHLLKLLHDKNVKGEPLKS